jgi:TrpR family transcriptional regulator, trp operon repressor
MLNLNLQALVSLVLSLKTEADVEDFLKGILTPKELAEITQRLEIIKLLKQGVPHRQIAEQLGVGVATVTRGSKELQLGRFKHV